MPDHIIIVNSHVGGSASNVNQGNPGLFLIIGEHSRTGSQGFQDQLFDIQTYSVYTNYDVKIRFQSLPEHSNGILHPCFAVHDVVLGKHMNNLFANVYRNFMHIVDKILQIITGNFILVRIPVDVTTVPDRFDMLSGDSHKNFIELDA